MSLFFVFIPYLLGADMVTKMLSKVGGSENRFKRVRLSIEEGYSNQPPHFIFLVNQASGAFN